MTSIKKIMIICSMLCLSIFACKTGEHKATPVPQGCCAIFEDSLQAWLQKSDKLHNGYTFRNDSLIISINTYDKKLIWPNFINDSSLSLLAGQCGFSIQRKQDIMGDIYLFNFNLDKTDSSYTIPCDILLHLFENRQ